MKRYGVIDLGTNTFHLLIVEQLAQGGFKELYRERAFVKLAEDGIQTIGKVPFDRGIQTLTKYKEVIDSFALDNLKAFGTAALRTATNGPLFVQTAKEEANIEIELISGNQEAQLIYKGVSQAVPFEQHNSLIMDIGGGSVEFIIANKDGLKWAKSFPIGVAVLYNDFHKSDPITANETAQILQHLEQILQPLIQQLEQYPIYNLIGASGTFDVLENVLAIEKTSPIRAIVPVQKFAPFYKTLLQSNLQERFQDDKIPDSRAELIIVAIILIEFVLKKMKIQQIDVSAYAMKEGILGEMMK